MTTRIMILILACFSAFLIEANDNRAPFVSSSSVTETIKQHKVLPDPADEVWWVPTGKDMAWNNKHLQQLFPSVPVYRDGQVRELNYALSQEVADFLVETPDGKVRFVDFLDSNLNLARLLRSSP